MGALIQSLVETILNNNAVEPKLLSGLGPQRLFLNQNYKSSLESKHRSIAELPLPPLGFLAMCRIIAVGAIVHQHQILPLMKKPEIKK